MEALRFTLPEVLSLIGVVQCVYILVHMCFRSGNLRGIVLALLYFFVLGVAFFLDLARSQLFDLTPYYNVYSWSAWALGPPLSVLLIIQMARITSLPSILYWLLLLIVPFAFIVARGLVGYMNQICIEDWLCSDFFILLNITGAVAGSASFLVIWSQRTIFTDILSQKAGQERYWLILSLIILNIAMLSLSIFRPEAFHFILIRTVIGLAFVYLVSTSLLRIYPNALLVSYRAPITEDSLSEDKDIAEKIQELLKLDKIYHEATYSRSDLARELGVSEGTVSRVINLYFNKSFPKLLNEYRVEDSKQLLLETDAAVSVISQEVGFNSLPSFNRVFKELVGQSPSSYRKNIIK